MVNANTPTKSALLQFLDTAVSKGWMNSNTGGSWKAAVNRILENVPIEKDITDLDVREEILRFNNRHPGDLSPDSLRTYESRIKSAIEHYLSYSNDPTAYKPLSRASGPRTSKRPTENMTAIPPTEKMPSVVSSERLVSETSLALPFPLRPGYLAQIVIPRDLTKPEADRLCAFIQTLAQEAQMEVQSQ